MMSDPTPSIQRSWLERLSQALLREPQDREQLVHLLRDAEQRDLLDADTLSMIEGVLIFSELKARDIMIPKQQMTTVFEDDTLDVLMQTVIDSGHSRFPVVSQSKDEILGILHAKDLIACREKNKKKFDIEDIVRPASFVPESKRLDILLKEFRRNRNHMAIVVDEYGGVSGFVTIEDVLEQIVGDIEDEFDIDEDAFIKKHSNNKYIIKAHMPIEDFNEYFNLNINSEEFDTIGGMLLKHLGHLPKVDDIVAIDSFQFKIINADKRRIKLIEAVPLKRIA